MFYGEIDADLLRTISALSGWFAKKETLYMSAGQAIGAVMALFVVAGEAYKVILKQKAFDVLAIMRPVAFSLVIVSWSAFVTGIGVIPRQMEEETKKIFLVEQANLITLRETRIEAAKKIKERTLEAKAAADIAEKQITDGNMWDKITEMGSDFLEKISEQIASFQLILEMHIAQIIEEWIMKIGYLFWGVTVYLLFFIKEVYAGILIITGPITFGLSVLPAFRDAWSQWIARYVSILLYGFIAYLILSGCCQIVEYGIKVDIAILTKANSSREAFAAYCSNWNVSALTQLSITLVGALALKGVPELATWIIPSQTTQSAGSFASGVKSAVTKTVTKGVTMGIK